MLTSENSCKKNISKIRGRVGAWVPWVCPFQFRKELWNRLKPPNEERGAFWRYKDKEQECQKLRYSMQA